MNQFVGALLFHRAGPVTFNKSLSPSWVDFLIYMMVICKVLSPNAAAGRCKLEGRKLMAPWLDKVTRVWRKMKHAREEGTQDNPFCRTARGHGAWPGSSLENKRNKRLQRLPGRLVAAKRCQSLQVQRAISARCLLCQKMMSSPVTASAISGSWCMEHISIISRESLFSPTWVADKRLQWQQKSGQVKGIPFWSGRKAPVTQMCSLWTPKVRRVTSLLLAVVTKKNSAQRLDGSGEVVKAGRRSLKMKNSSAQMEGNFSAKFPSSQKALLLCKDAIYLQGGEETQQKDKARQAWSVDQREGKKR